MSYKIPLRRLLFSPQVTTNSLRKHSRYYAMSDPYVQKAEKEASPQEKTQELLKIISEVKTGMLVTKNSDGNLHARAMAPASKDHLTFEFLANNNSGKFDELESNPDVNISFYAQSSTDWASISGKAKVSNDVNEIKRIYNPMIKAWFGDLGDGKHTGEPGDPRISIIVVEPTEIRYWLKTSTSLGQTFEVVKGAITGETAAPGVLRTISASELSAAKAAA